MSDAATWREKAALLRERATEIADEKRQQQLEVLSDDCEEIAARLEFAMVPAAASAEGWAVAAFMKKLPNVSPEDCRAWTGSSGEAPSSK